MILLAALLACSSGGTPPPPMADVTLQGGEDLCLGDSDCVVVELGCCSYCNGGKAIAANRSSAEAIKAKYGQQACEQYTCPSNTCEVVEASCQAGACGLKR